MFDFIRGVLIEVQPHATILDVGGVGYKLSTPVSLLEKRLAVGKETKLYASYVVRENLIALYGFLEKEERDLFELLVTLSGIGPKTALNIIGHLPLPEFQLAIANKNVALLSKIPGIGKKTAERLIVDLKEKVSKIALPFAPASSHKIFDAAAALMQLGYTQEAAHLAIQAVASELPEDCPLSSLVTAALKQKKLSRS